MKDYSVTIENHLTGEVATFDTNGILGALTDKESAPNGSDTTQFALGRFDTKELIKLLAGCTNMVYHLTNDPVKAKKIIELAQKVAYEGYKEQLK